MLAGTKRLRHDPVMKSMRLASAVALMSILIANPAEAATPLEPSGPWQVDFGDAHCIAARKYGSGDKAVVFLLKPAPLGDVMQVSVLRAGRKKEVGQYDGDMRIDEGPSSKVSILGYSPHSGKDRVSTINLPLAAFEPVRTAATLGLRSSVEINYSFALTQMAAVGRTLDRCKDNLRKAWHLAESVSEVRKDATPKSAMGRYFKSEDYPRIALRDDATGLVELALLIDEAGKVASCMVIGTSGYASLDAQSCAVITERGKFDPAIGIDGKPTRSGLIQRIRWDTRL